MASRQCRHHASGGTFLSAIEIREALRVDDIENIRVLFREYADEVKESRCFDAFAQELANLPGNYSPPQGALLLAAEGDDILGCVGVRPLRAEICELKRLYVRPAQRGRSVGRRLAEAAFSAALRKGYRWMRLDTLPRMTEAQHLYRSLQFREVQGEGASNDVIYFERRLS